MQHYFMLYFRTPTVSQTAHRWWQHGRWMINWKWRLMTRPWVNMRSYNWHRMRGPRKTTNSLSRYPVSHLRFETGTSQIQIYIITAMLTRSVCPVVTEGLQAPVTKIQTGHVPYTRRVYGIPTTISCPVYAIVGVIVKINLPCAACHESCAGSVAVATHNANHCHEWRPSLCFSSFIPGSDPLPSPGIKPWSPSIQPATSPTDERSTVTS
jgi:hypothetical protein